MIICLLIGDISGIKIIAYQNFLLFNSLIPKLPSAHLQNLTFRPGMKSESPGCICKFFLNFFQIISKLNRHFLKEVILA